MLSCINKNSIEYLSLKNRANIPEFLLEAMCRYYMTKYNRFPYLDELPNSNSEKHLKKTIKINEQGSSHIKDILDAMGTEDIETANIEINNLYRDLETKIIPIVNDAFVEIKHRPTNNNFNPTIIKLDETVNNYLIFNEALIKLSSLYGIKFNSITSEELNSELWRGIINNAQLTNAFVYNGEIYINTSKISVDSPLHEIMHLLIGSMRFTNPQLYQDLINSVESWNNYETLAKNYPNRSRNDINEEIFVTESSKLFLGIPSNLSNLGEAEKYEIKYNVKRVLDSILMGENSSKTISDNRLFRMSLKEIASELNSSVMVNKFHGTFNTEYSELHRKLNNMKSELIKNNTLKEICE